MDFTLYVLLCSVLIILLSYIYSRVLIIINNKTSSFTDDKMNTLKLTDFSWHKFVTGNLAVNVKSYADYKNFISKIYKYKMIFPNQDVSPMPYEYWNNYGREFCISYNVSEKELRYNTRKYYVSKNYDIIEWDRREVSNC